MANTPHNPYEPPKSVQLDSSPGSLLAQPICLTLQMNTGYLMDAFARIRERNPMRKRWLYVRWPISVFLLVISAMLVVNAEPLFGFAFAAFVIGSFFAYRIDDLYYRFTLSRSPWLNAECEIEISDAGYQVQALGYGVTVPWSAFKVAEIFDDGVLLYQSDTSSPWIPWSAFSTAADAARFRDFALHEFANHQHAI
ncbi:YcxB family protein [Stieleria sp. TO1_6]|uniref:YcxB family protein n=1 Tax=Stieleria tagensis TaxID=2956795 RepID=UPI00209B51CB|nr:YcxB family protein [Stieleria tagensis]MCO8120566.1 YcxB family protein [Stieleria tagensis]